MVNPLCKCILALLLATSVAAAGWAQGGDLYYLKNHYPGDPYDDQTHIDAGVNYQSNNVYMGREDSLALPYYTAYTAWHLFNGIYAKVSASYTHRKKSGHFDLLALELGYDHTFGDRILAGASIEKDFYNRNSPAVRAQIKETGSLYIQRRDGLIEPQLSLDVNYNKAADYVFGLRLDHDYHLADNTLNIIPAFNCYMGTMLFYDDYFIRRIARLYGHEVPQVLNSPGNFKPLDIDLDIRTSYRTGGWLFVLMPTYSIPLSPATINLPTGAVQEHLSNTLFAELDVCYRIMRK